MKKFRIAGLILSAFLCLALAGCSAQESTTSLSAEEQQSLGDTAKQYVEYLGVLEDVSLEQLKQQAADSGNTILEGGIQSLMDSREDTGLYKSVNSYEITDTDEGYLITMDTTFEKRDVEIVLGLTSDFQAFTDFTVNPEYTMGEKMKKAALNLVIGMITVFAVLIFLALIISCFKYLNKAEEKFKNKGKAKAEPKKAKADVAAVSTRIANAPAANAPAGTPAISNELVAVITAAIAASAGTTTEGLIVRSIKRAPSSNWKR